MKKSAIYVGLVSAVAAVFLAGCGGGDGVSSGKSKHGAAKIDASKLGPEAAMAALVESVQDGRPENVFDLLPASYQSDLNGLVAAFAGKMDEGIWNDSRVMVQRIARIMETKKDILLSSDVMSDFGLESEDKVEFEKAYDEAGKMFKLIAHGAITDLQVLKKGDIRFILAQDGAAFIQSLQSGVSSMVQDDGDENPWDMIAKMQFELVSQDSDDRATLKVRRDGEDEETIILVKVDDAWVPEEMAEDWAEMIADAKLGLNQIDFSSADQRMGARMVLGLLDGIVTQVEKAQSVEDLERAFESIGGMMGF